jgi:hypothetical protein
MGCLWLGCRQQRTAPLAPPFVGHTFRITLLVIARSALVRVPLVWLIHHHRRSMAPGLGVLEENVFLTQALALV